MEVRGGGGGGRGEEEEDCDNVVETPTDIEWKTQSIRRPANTVLCSRTEAAPRQEEEPDLVLERYFRACLIPINVGARAE